MRVPDGVVAYAVSNRSTDGSDTLKLSTIAAGKIIPANRAVIFNSKEAEPRFVPTTLSTNTSVLTTYAKGFYCDSLVQDANSYKFTYEFRNGNRGLGFYRTHGEVIIPGGKIYAQFGLSTAPGAESYVLGESLNPVDTATGIETVSYSQPEGSASVYTIGGQRVKGVQRHGIYIVGGKKIVR